MRIVKSLTVAGSLAAALTVLPVLSLAATNPAMPEQRAKALNLLKQVRDRAADAKFQVSELQNLWPNSMDWNVHAEQLELFREDINDMGRVFVLFENVRDSATPAEREAMARAQLSVKQMAENTGTAITYLNANHDRLWAPAYQGYVGKLVDESSRLSKQVGEFVQLAEARAREKHFENALGATAGE